MLGDPNRWVSWVWSYGGAVYAKLVKVTNNKEAARRLSCIASASYAAVFTGPTGDGKDRYKKREKSPAERGFHR